MDGLTNEQFNRLRAMLEGPGPTMSPEQMLGGGWDALNMGLNRPAAGMQQGLQRGIVNLPEWMGGGGGKVGINEGVQVPRTPTGIKLTDADLKIPKYTSSGGGHLLRFAGSKPVQMGLKIGTGLGAVGGVLGAGDVLLGNDSLANKAMDTAAMGIGGFLGMAGGPVGAAAGAGLGKMGSDSLQWLFGDKKTAEQRQMEQALTALQGGNY